MVIYDNKDDITEAIHGLDIFTKNWCMNCNETELRGEPIFMCDKCEFQLGTGQCSIKKFAFNHESDYDLGHFGSMGSH